MLSVVLKILSILGILLVCVLGLAVLLLLLVLFFPVCYRVSGKKNTEEMTVNARAWWLFGLLRASFAYPEPGKILVKVLPFTVFDSGKTAGGKGKKSADSPDDRAGKGGAGERQKEDAEAAGGQTPEKVREQAETAAGGRTSEDTTGKVREQAETAVGEQPPGETAGNRREQETTGSGESAEDTGEKDRERTETTGGGDSAENGKVSFFQKIGKIKYTIHSIYDKIKNIWENISYYIDLLREEETRLLFSHVLFRLGKVLKNIRPRRIRGQILFGTGSPDTTGYAYGVYGMLSPFLGDRLAVTPDFTRAVLEGDICIAGHITVFTILWNGLRVLLDRKLRRFIKKMKAGRKR